jgi:hypothetical protein
MKGSASSLETGHKAARRAMLKRGLLLAAGNVLVLAVLLVLVEGLCYAVFRWVPFEFALHAARKYHLGYERKNVQYLPKCARHNPLTSYTLRPGRCSYASREFSITITANSAGLRDDEASLHQPEIIVLGDSQGMGWGVEGHETFASRIEAASGRKVLNAAISSFGTAREMIMLRQLDRSALKYLVIQYCDNDVPENMTYLRQGNRLKIMRDVDYAVLRDRQLRRSFDYYPGKFTHLFFPTAVQVWREGPSGRAMAAYYQRRSPVKEARAFLQVISASGLDLRGIKFIVLEVAGFNRNLPAFAAALPSALQWLRKKGGAANFDEITVLSSAEHLTDSHYYVYDDHMRPSGHAVVADLIMQEID